MIKCFELLKGIMGDHLVHVTCWAHKFSIFGDILQKNLSELNSITSQTKNCFHLSRKIKHLYCSYLNENHGEESIPLYLEPVVTRWGSWFKLFITYTNISMF